jgi:type 1 glutamine amidotransferase
VRSLIFLIVSFNANLVYCQIGQAYQPKNFRILVLAENGGHHIKFTQAAKPWLNQLAKENQFTIDYIENTDLIDSAYLSNYQLFLQLDYPPYGWPEKAVDAFEDFINSGKGGWIGLHHATLLGEFDGYPMWSWFSNFMGGIRFKNYIPTFVDGEVTNEDITHPVMKNLPQHFIIEREEWYTYDKTPRSNVKVLASVNEKTYKPDSEIKMGDHPVIWTNPSVRARNVYIFMGHSPDLFSNPYFPTILKNAIFWAAGK